MDDLPPLRADIPALEPDDVLLGQLVELSSAGAASARRRAARPVRALAMGGAALGLVAATSWIAGALPGVPSPITPPRHPAPAPTSPATPDRTEGAVRVPGADGTPTSGASRPHTQAPDVAPGRAASSAPSVPAVPAATWTPPRSPSAAPTPGEGRAVGRGSGKHPDRGRHLGQKRTKSQPKGKPTPSEPGRSASTKKPDTPPGT